MQKRKQRWLLVLVAGCAALALPFMVLSGAKAYAAYLAAFLVFALLWLLQEPKRKSGRKARRKTH
jgi:drug/metabolite transporter superfamily protein YnfA